MNNVRSVLVHDDTTLSSRRTDLDKAEFVAVMHHEPHKSLPYANRWDLLTIRTLDHAFHILPLTNPTLATQAISVLQTFQGVVYARSPQGLQRIMQEDYAWSPEFTDITPFLEQLINKDTPESQWRKSNFSDICNTYFSCSPCWTGRFFSCHSRPSRCALKHREYFASQVYIFGRDYAGAHKTEVGAAAVGAPAAEEERRLQEERLQEERQQEEEECRRREERLLQQEEEQREAEERRRVLQEIEEGEERLHEEKEKLRSRRREFERKELHSRKRSRSPSHGRRHPSGRTSDAADSADGSSRRRRR